MTARDGKPCKKCNTGEWYKSGKCVACGKESDRRYRAANRDKANEASRRWRLENPDKSNEATRRWAAANPDKSSERKRRWSAANRDKKRESDRQWHAANRGRMNEHIRRWRQANSEKVVAIRHRRRTRKTEAGGSFTGAEWKALVAHQNGRCLACGKKAKLTADHVIPISLGGSSDISNIQGLCLSCNSSKGTKTIDYRKGKGLLRWIQQKLFQGEPTQ